MNLKEELDSKLKFLNDHRLKLIDTEPTETLKVYFIMAELDKVNREIKDTEYLLELLKGEH